MRIQSRLARLEKSIHSLEASLPKKALVHTFQLKDKYEHDFVQAQIKFERVGPNIEAFVKGSFPDYLIQLLFKSSNGKKWELLERGSRLYFTQSYGGGRGWDEVKVSELPKEFEKYIEKKLVSLVPDSLKLDPKLQREIEDLQAKIQELTEQLNAKLAQTAHF